MLILWEAYLFLNRRGGVDGVDGVDGGGGVGVERRWRRGWEDRREGKMKSECKIHKLIKLNYVLK